MATLGIRVTNQTESQDLTPSGSFVKIHKVYWEMNDGTRGSIDVPDSIYSEDYVRDRLGQVLAQKSAVNAINITQ